MVLCDISFGVWILCCCCPSHSLVMTQPAKAAAAAPQLLGRRRRMEPGGRGEERGRLGGPPSLLLPSCPPPTPQSLWPPWSPVRPAGGQAKGCREGGREPAGPGRGAGAGGGGGGGGRGREEEAETTWESDIGYKFNSSPENTARAGRVRPAGRRRAAGGGPGPGARPARVGGLRPPLPAALAGGTPPPPRPLLPPSRGRRRARCSPPRGLLLTLRKTPDVRGWLSATGGSGFPASPACPPPPLPPSRASSAGFPAPPEPAAPRAPLLSREHPPSQPAGSGGRRSGAGSTGFPPRPRGPWRAPEARAWSLASRRGAAARPPRLRGRSGRRAGAAPGSAVPGAG